MTKPANAKANPSEEELDKLKLEYSQVATEVSELVATIFWDINYIVLPFFFLAFDDINYLAYFYASGLM